jgi:hypothetical protein
VLISKLLYAVVEQGGATLTLEECLANKVKRVKSAVKALVGSIKTVLLSYYCNSTVIISSVIKYKVTN